MTSDYSFSMRLRRLFAGLAVLVSLLTSASADKTEAISVESTHNHMVDIRPILGTLVDIAGTKYHPFDSTTTRAAVFVFVLSDCPISNSYAQEYNRLFDEYSSKGIELYLVHPDPRTTKEVAQRHRKEYQLKQPVLLDPEHVIVKATGATITPETAVINAKGELVYRGRIDDRYVKLGKRSERVTSTELRDALNAILEDRPILHSRAPAVGCSISDLK